MEWKPIVGEDDDKEDQVDTEVQHVCQELEIEDVHSLQSNIADIRVASGGGVKVVQQGRRKFVGAAIGTMKQVKLYGQQANANLVFPSALHVGIKG